MHTAVEQSPGAMKPTVPLGKRRVSYCSPTRAGRLRYSSSEKSHMVASLSENNVPSLTRGDVATPQGGLSSGDPFARHIAEGNCVRIPLGGLLQLDLFVHDYAADGFVGHFGFILEAAQKNDLFAAHDNPRECHLASSGLPAERL